MVMYLLVVAYGVGFMASWVQAVRWWRSHFTLRFPTLPAETGGTGWGLLVALFWPVTSE